MASISEAPLDNFSSTGAFASGFKLGVELALAVSASSLFYEKASYYIFEGGISLITDGHISVVFD
jgi:hypothetical protein